MRQRCRNPNSPSYPNYGGRGITVCERWQDFALFLADMGEKPTPVHSIDRIDNDGPYSPENCRWATPAEQRRNQAQYLAGECRNGHPFDESNTYITPRGTRACRACNAAIARGRN